MKPWYQSSAADVLQRLKSSKQGLLQADAEQRLQQYGENEIQFKQKSAWLRFLEQFWDPMIIILLITATVTGVLTALGMHMLPDTLVIITVVVINAFIGFIQEGKAEGAMAALRQMMVVECLVQRDNHKVKISAKTLVPGDILALEAGDKIPADVRFLETNNLHVDESALTGESVPVGKMTEPLDQDNLVPGDQRNMGFSGTYITQGTALAAVVETGMSTAFGKIATMVKETTKKRTPLQEKLHRFVNTLIIAILCIGLFNFLFGVNQGYSISYSFLGAVSLVVAAIPEMLPALVTSILALSGTMMARKKAVIRHLPAAETLGATSVICSDKTGTLTENRMTVTRLFAGGDIYDVTGTGYSVDGQFKLAGESVEVARKPALKRLLMTGYVCNNAHLSGDHVSGDPTEIALKVSGAKADLVAAVDSRLEEMPFDSSVKYMAVLVKEGPDNFIYVKGAPEIIINMCHSVLGDEDQLMSLDADEALHTAQSFARDALRTLGFAFKKVPATHTDLSHDDLSELIFVGFQGLIDPPKDSARQAVAQCTEAGIRTVMITGDHPDTAFAVAKQLGIHSERAVTGAELSQLSEQELQLLVKDVSVYARVAPEHKKEIARAFQQNNNVVAMTGDGVNDAPALKQADIGIAMGQVGTEVAKESSDMILADDNFATIVSAVEEGRHAWNNLQKAILYTLPTNAAQAMLIMGAILAAASMPVFAARFVLEPVQILWINLLDSVLLTLPLMMERKESGLLKTGPRNPSIQIINKLFLQRVVLIGLAISLPGFYIYAHFGSAAILADGTVDDLLLTQAQTAAFWAVLFAHIGYVISARSIHTSFFRINPLSNPWLLAGIAGSLIIRMIPTVWPQAAVLFRTAEFPVQWWPTILLCLLPSFICIEVDKLIRNYGSKHKSNTGQHKVKHV